MAADQKSMFSSLDFPLLSGIFMICGIGMIALYSASGEDVDMLIKHSARLGFAFLAMYVVSRIPTSTLSTLSLHLYCAGLVLLVLVLSVGIIGKGAQRWIDLGFVRFQPSEIMKITVPMMTAWILTKHPLPPRKFTLSLAVLAVAVPCVLIILQPDLGTSLLIAASGSVVIFLAGISWKLILSLGVAGVVAAPLVWNLVLHDYQKERIITLFDPWSDSLGAGYHTVQSIIAIGSGGVRGKGWLSGTQSQLEFIPERSTDFIFSVYGEEFGLAGVILLLVLYLFLVARGMWIALNIDDSYSKLLAGGLSITFFIYVFVNIGMVSGILPVVGVPLPFVSYGGTSIVTLMIGFGILMGISRRIKPY
ncbi:MAG: rod shape-determining protein RodA [Gammaproteobacteria bacterium]|nr:rod shape-determining protein RodA [Gammaproteobacteria bacterium]MYD76744.1 rod shape-determining protein RodA [Gammaproteobacteria bacterium]MYJ52196.1 rod shape-determining protein RodA [Gammaproteobacteria bacterium]